MLQSDVSFSVLDLNLLRVLDAVMVEGSVAGAATRLSITPSAVSHALGRLRALFNDPLFVRSPHGMRATPRGAEIGPKVREGLRYLEGALAPADFRAAESRRIFTVACSAYVSAVLLPGVIAQMRQCAPKAGLKVTSWGAGVLDRFTAGQIDVLLGDFVRVPEGFERQALFEDRLVWLMGRDYVLPSRLHAANEDRIAVARAQLSAAQSPVTGSTVFEGGFERRTALDECCRILGNPVGHDGTGPGPALESLPYSLIAPLVVKHADLVALLPSRLALLFAQDLRLDIVEPVPEAAPDRIEIGAVWHPDHGHRPAVSWFRGLLAELAARPLLGSEHHASAAGCA
jgi:DNA-binding transcriptional LysR family regulator